MTNQEKSENRLREKFYKELLPKWDFEKVFLEYGKKLLEKKELQKAIHIFDDVLYVNPESEKAQKLKKKSILKFLKNQDPDYLDDSIKVLFEDQEIPLKRENGSWVAYIINSGRVSIEFLNKNIFSRYFSKNEILISQEAYVALKEKNLKPLLFETENFKIEIHKSSHAAKLILYLKEI
jgi:hypothetical protein